MQRARRFEDFVAWKKARSLTGSIYRATSAGRFGSDRRLAGQARAAAVSIMSNIAEGFERGGLNEFHRFLCIAKGSCAELRSQLYVAQDAGYLSTNDSTRLHQEANEVARLLGGLRAAVDRERRSPARPALT